MPRHLEAAAQALALEIFLVLGVPGLGTPGLLGKPQALDDCAAPAWP